MNATRNTDKTMWDRSVVQLLHSKSLLFVLHHTNGRSEPKDMNGTCNAHKIVRDRLVVPLLHSKSLLFVIGNTNGRHALDTVGTMNSYAQSMDHQSVAMKYLWIIMQ